jgi:hypothetical protein
VVDAAGAIYVLGGFSGGTAYQDVWASTRPPPRGPPRAPPGVLRGYSGGTTGVLENKTGVLVG